MLDGDTLVSIVGAGTPGPDGLVKLPLVDGTVTIPLSSSPTELTQVLFKPPTDTQPGDQVTVNVKYTDQDGNPQEVVREIYSFWDDILNIIFYVF